MWECVSKLNTCMDESSFVAVAISAPKTEVIINNIQMNTCGSFYESYQSCSPFLSSCDVACTAPKSKRKQKQRLRGRWRWYYSLMTVNKRRHSQKHKTVPVKNKLPELLRLRSLKKRTIVLCILYSGLYDMCQVQLLWHEYSDKVWILLFTRGTKKEASFLQKTVHQLKTTTQNVVIFVQI